MSRHAEAVHLKPTASQAATAADHLKSTASQAEAAVLQELTVSQAEAAAVHRAIAAPEVLKAEAAAATTTVEVQAEDNLKFDKLLK